MNIDRLLQQGSGDEERAGAIPPLDEWQPALSGDMNIVIHADGSWWHEGQPFARPKVARLLATLLRLDDEGRLDAEHPLSVTSTPQGEAVPQLPVRFGLAARLHRNVFYQLVEAADTRDVGDGKSELGLTSAGQWFALGQVDDELLGEAP